jgi:hypothetical protein
MVTIETIGTSGSMMRLQRRHDIIARTSRPRAASC